MDSSVRSILRDLYSGKEQLSRRIVVQLLRGGAYKEVAQLYADTRFVDRLIGGKVRASIGAMCRIIAAPDRDIVRALSISERISSRLSECNGRRRTRLLDHQDIATVIATTHRTSRYASVLAGSVGAGYSYPSWTTAALCFRPTRSRTLYLGIEECPAAAASMGRCWHILQPWHSSTMSPAIEARRLNNLDAWAQDPDRIRIPKYLVSLVVGLLNNYWRSDGTSDWIRDILGNPANFLLWIE